MDWWYIVAGSLVLLGIALFFYFATRRKYRDPSAAPNYEKVRDKLTLREIEPEPEEEDKYEDNSESDELSAVNWMQILISLVVFSAVIFMAMNMLSIISQDISGLETTQESNAMLESLIALESAANFFPVIAVISVIVIILIVVMKAISLGQPDIDYIEPKKEGKEHYKHMRDALTRRKQRK